MPTLEEEDLPLVDPELLEEDVIPETPDSPVISDRTPAGESDVLRNYFANQKLQRERLSNAEDTATQNRFGARLGGAFNTLAHAASPKPADNSAFEGMAKDANNPVDRIERQQKLEQGGDKLLLNYFMNKSKAEGLSGWRDKKLGIDQQRVDVSRDRNKVIGDIAQANLGLRERGLGLRSRLADLRETTVAAGAAKTINNDKVVMTTEAQLNSANKGLGRLDDVDKGKVPFSTTTKADLEADLANLISGSTSSALGKLERVEFHPYVGKWQSALDKMKGYQGDINAPEYKAQLRAQFEGLRNDILEIQLKRKQNLLAANKTAYSKAPLAAAAMQEAAGTSQEPTKPKDEGALPGSTLPPADQKALKWALDPKNEKDPRAVEIIKRLSGRKK